MAYISTIDKIDFGLFSTKNCLKYNNWNIFLVLKKEP